MSSIESNLRKWHQEYNSIQSKFYRMKNQRPQTQEPCHEGRQPRQFLKFGIFGLGRIIGQGACALVRAVTHLTTKKEFAIKIYEKSKLQDPMKKLAVQREIQALKRINHPNIVRFVDMIETGRQLGIVTELIEGTSLHSFLKVRGKPMTESNEKAL